MSEQNEAIEEFFTGLSPSESTYYSLWKLTRKIKNSPQQLIPPLRQGDGKWAKTSKDKIKAFAEHFKKVFELATQETTEEEIREREIMNYLEKTTYMIKTTQKVKANEVQKIIDELKQNSRL